MTKPLQSTSLGITPALGFFSTFLPHSILSSSMPLRRDDRTGKQSSISRYDNLTTMSREHFHPCAYDLTIFANTC